MVTLRWSVGEGESGVTLRNNPSKTEEIFFLKALRDKLPQDSYLKSLFNSRLVDAAEGAIQSDLMPDVWDWYMRETVRSSNLSQQKAQLKSYVDHLHHMIERHEETIENLTAALQHERKASEARKERLKVLEDVVS